MFKDAPTFSQLGFDDDIGYMNRVILAPRGIPAARLKVLRTAIAKLKKNKTYKKMMKKLGENTAYMGGEDYEKIRAKQKKRYGNLVKKLTN
jgi:tripartite-type tricarboxylate transporter receptor subunit TctC